MKTVYEDKDVRNALNMGAKALDKEAVRLGGIETCLESVILRELAGIGRTVRESFAVLGCNCLVVFDYDAEDTRPTIKFCARHDDPDVR
jgi:hypothetical protein